MSSTGANMRPNKRAKTARASTAKESESPVVAVLALLSSGQLPLLDFLDEDAPLDILKLLYVCKATRKASVRKLRAMQEDPATKRKQQTFEKWILDPHLSKEEGKREDAYQEISPEESKGKLYGPLRLLAIKNSADYLRKCFVILKYTRDYYVNEKCCVAVIQEDGTLVGVFALESRCVRLVDRRCLLKVGKVGNNPAPTHLDPLVTCDDGGKLSPAEVYCALIHALCLDGNQIKALQKQSCSKLAENVSRFLQLMQSGEYGTDPTAAKTAFRRLQAKKDFWENAEWEAL